MNWKFVAAMSLGGLLSACGGGGGGVTPEPPVDPATLAQKAGLSAVYTVKPYELPSFSRVAKLKWTDVFNNETGYRIEVQKADGQWEEVGRLPAQAGSGGVMSYDLVSWSSARVLADLPSQTVRLRTVSLADALPAMTQGPADLGLKMDRTEPLAGVVTLKVNPPSSAKAPPSLKVNGQALILTSPDFSTAWDTRALPDGRYAYELGVSLDADRRYEDAGSLAVANSTPSALVKFGKEGVLAGASIDILRWDNAASQAPELLIPQLLLDGVVVANPVLTGCMGEPRCLRYGGRNLTGIYVRIEDVPSGDHQMTVRMATKDGGGRDYSATVSFDRLPVLTLAADPAGSLLGDSLRVQGNLSDDGRAATLDVMLDGVTRTQATQGDFDVRLDTAALSVGEHQLTLLARDLAGQVTRLDRPLLKLPAGQSAQPMGAQLRMQDASPTTILASDATQAFSTPSVWLRAGSPVERLVLPLDASLPKIANWAVADQAVIGAADGTAPRRWFVWDARLQRTEPDGATGGIGGYFDQPLVEGSWLATANGNTENTELRVSLRNLVTGQLVPLERLPSFTRFGVTLSPGALAALPDGSARLVWRADDALLFGSSLGGAPVVLERGDFSQPMTDGNQVVWQRTAGGAPELMVRGVTPGGTSTRLAPQAGGQLGRVALRSGLLTWTESDTAGKVQLYVLHEGKPLLVAGNIGGLVDTAQRRIVYVGNDAQLMVWTAARGARSAFPAGRGLLRGSSLMVEWTASHDQGLYLYRVPLEQFD